MHLFLRFLLIVFAMSNMLLGAVDVHAQLDKFSNAAVVADKEERPFWETEKTPDKLKKRYERRLPSFKSIDKNNDWALDSDEIDSFIFHEFKAYDADQDGKLSKEELALMRDSFSQNRSDIETDFGKDRTKRFDLRMKHADKNDDGLLSWKESYTYYRTRFNRMDKDLDDIVQFKEYRMIDDRLVRKSGRDDKAIKVPEYKTRKEVDGE